MNSTSPQDQLNMDGYCSNCIAVPLEDGYEYTTKEQCNCVCHRQAPESLTSEQEWEKEFFDKFQDICTEYGSGLVCINDEYTASMSKLIISFISTQRQQAAEEAIEKYSKDLLNVYKTAASIDDRSDIECLLSVIRDKIKKG